MTRVSTAHAGGTAAPTVNLGGWVQARWVTILDRIELRDPDVGLRFWGPPLWLEVTMTGPDSDLWPAITEEVSAWDWQSSAPCGEVAELAEAGADDDVLLAVVGCYTIENLILNAVHEIGEWLRFDGRRLFRAHTADVATPQRDEQGNGPVSIHLEFRRPASPTEQPVSSDDLEVSAASMRCFIEAVSPTRFSYLPGITISYETTGPVGRRCLDGQPTTSWRARWSRTTIDAARSGRADLPGDVGRDVHRALVSFEADRICRAFYIDGSRPWSLADAAGHGTLGADPPDVADHTQLLAVSIDYADDRCPN